MKQKTSTTILATALMFCISFAKAQFTGSFVTSNWGTVQISCDGYVDLSNAPTSILLISGDDGSGNPGTIDFTITVPQSGNLSFDWDYSTSDGPEYDYPLYVINGNEFLFSTYDDMGNDNQNGSETCISLQQGDQFAFRMYTMDNDAGAATVEISNFAFTQGINVTPTATTVCGATPITFNATGANSYTWSNGSTNGVPFNAPNATTTLVVTGMVGNCLATNEVVVNVLPSPSLALSGIPSSVCTGTVLTVTASGASTYNWPGLSATTTTMNFAISGPTVITVQGSVATCTAQLSQTVNVLQSPALVINAPTEICAGKTATLVASGANSYAWNTLAQTATITPTPANTATYSVFGYSVNGCFAVAFHTVTVNALPTLSITPGSTSVCVGQLVQLTAAGAVTYLWNNQQTNASISVTPTTAVASYSVSGTNAAGCTGNKTISIITSACVGLSEIDNNKPFTRVYPNPSNGFISFESSHSLSMVQITDVNGKMVNQFDISDNTTTLNLEDLTNGVYFVKALFNDSKSYSVTKLIIAK